MSMWMSHHREWKDDRHREKDVVFWCYTSGIWEFDEQPRRRYDTGYQYHGYVLHDGGCRGSPGVGGARMMAYAADGWFCRYWEL